MIRADKQRHALAALHKVLVAGRSLAYEKGSADAAHVLDQAEFLVVLVLDEEDRTDVFRDLLVGLADWNPRLAWALERFDAEVPW